LQLLDFALQVVLLLLLLGQVIGLLNLLVDGLELLDALGHLLEALVDFLLQFSRCHLAGM
jgi:hypothetical protein